MPWRKSGDLKQISTHTLTWSVTERRVKIIENKVISTHTLTWSVTGITIGGGATSSISTHTLTWSVTDDVTQASILKTNFNSHAHVERDFAALVASSNVSISTHTLTWSVTVLPCLFLPPITVFQLTRSRGA